MPLGQVLQRWSHRLGVQRFCKLAYALQVCPSINIKIARNSSQLDHIRPHGSEKRHSTATARKPDQNDLLCPACSLGLGNGRIKAVNHLRPKPR